MALLSYTVHLCSHYHPRPSHFLFAQRKWNNWGWQALSLFLLLFYESEFVDQQATNKM